MLVGMITYMGECDEHLTSHTEQKNVLRAERVVVLSDAIKGLMDDGEWHRQADDQITDLQA